MPPTKQPVQTEKRCPHCGETKPAEGFYWHKGYDRLCSWCKTCIRKDGKRYPESQKDSALRNLYGLNLAKYNDLLVAQAGKCAICGTEDPGKRSKFFCVDHSHATGKVRGLLCSHCNRMLGHAKDDPTILFAAVEYLRQ